MSFTGQSDRTWATSISDVRALDEPVAQPHQVSLYFLDWDSGGRTQFVQVLDAATDAVLDSRFVSSFSGGKYLTWSLSDAVKIKITKVTGADAVVSGIFFDEATVGASGARASYATAYYDAGGRLTDAVADRLGQS